MKNINRLNMKSFLCLLFFLLTFIDFLHSQVVHQMTFTRFHHYEIDDWVTYGPALDITSISVGEDYIYCGTRFGGILRYHIFDNFWDYPFTSSSGLKNNEIFDVVYDFEGNRIFSQTIEGINVYNTAFDYWEFKGSGTMPSQRTPLSTDLDDYLQNGNYRFPQYYRPSIKELPDFFTNTEYVFRPPDEVMDVQNRIFKINNEIVVDKHRNLWIGTNGLGCAQASLNDFNLTFHHQSISNIVPRDLYFDSNEIWIVGLNTGNGPGGINYWNYDTDDWKYYEDQFYHGIYNDNCYTINGSNKFIFFGSQEGLIRYNKKNGGWKTFTTVNGLESNKINHLYFFKKHLFIATDEGFNWMEPNYNRIEESKDTMLDNIPVYRIAASKSKIYMATRNGIYIYDLEKDRTEYLKIKSAALDLYISAINIQGDELWIAGKYGIMMYNSTKDKWQSFIGILETVTGNIHTIEFTENNVWFATDNGLLKYDENRNFWYLYTIEDGLADNKVYNIIPDSEDLWLCTQKGISIFRWYREGRFE